VGACRGLPSIDADVLSVSQSVYISRRLDKGNMVTTAHPRKRDVAVGVVTVCAIAMLGFVVTWEDLPPRSSVQIKVCLFVS
jgi:hypothetical protein